jgi:hypothetical protein
MAKDNTKPTLKAPSTKEITGVLVSVDTIETQKGDIVLLSIQDAQDEIFKVSTSPNYWKKVGKLFATDAVVKASFEVRIENVTGYPSETTGELVPHQSSGNNLSGITRFSALSFQRMLDNLTKDADIATISTVEPERVSAVASYLSAYVKR